MSEIRKLCAFLRRDLIIAASYRVSFVTSLVALVFGLTSISFFARLVDSGQSPALASYGNDYFTYALVGVSIAIFVQSVAGLPAATVRSAQQTGTLEVLICSRTSLSTFLAGSALYGVIFAIIRLVAVFLLGAFLFGAHLALGQAPVAILTLLLSLAAFAGIGILGAAFVVVFKQSEPFTSALMTGSLLLSGVLYPTSVLPRWLASVASLLPLTHATAALRATLLQRADFTTVLDQLVILAAFAFLLPFSLLVFTLSVSRAREAGSLGLY